MARIPGLLDGGCVWAMFAGGRWGRRVGVMNRAPLRFFFDYVSPYAYLAWTQLPALAERHGRTVELLPVLFAGVLNTLGTTGPAEVKPKRFYIYKHTRRIAHELGVPFVMPA